MKQQLAVLFVLLSGYLLVSCQKQALSPPENNLAAEAAKMNDEKVPFSGHYSTSIQVLSGPPILRQRFTGIGLSTHLGLSSFVALSAVNLTTPPPFQITGTAIFTAANGDDFNTTFTGTSTPNGDGTSAVVIYHTILGGTGKFEHAAGSLTANTTANPALSTGTITYKGNISY